MHTPPASLVASAESVTSIPKEDIARAVNESVAGEIANLGSPESRRSYECCWRYFRIWLMDQPIEVAPHQIKITAVRPKHVTQYIAKLRAEGKKKGTMGRALSVLRSLYGRLVCDELMPNNPAREVKSPKVDSTPKTPWISNPADIKKLINVPGDSWTERRDRLIVRAGFGLGWRRSEIARIRVEDIVDGVITAPRIKGGKTLRVGLPDRLAEDIFEWCQFAGIESGPLFLRSEHGDRRQIDGAVVYRVVKQMCAKAGIKVVPPHALRRTFITQSGIRNVPLKTRQLAVGHSNSQTTEGYDRARDAAANAVGNVFEDLFNVDAIIAEEAAIDREYAGIS